VAKLNPGNKTPDFEPADQVEKDLNLGDFGGGGIR